VNSLFGQENISSYGYGIKAWK